MVWNSEGQFTEMDDKRRRLKATRDSAGRNGQSISDESQVITRAMVLTGQYNDRCRVEQESS